MERRLGTERRKWFFGRLLRDEEQRANPDQGASALLGVRATSFGARRAWRKVRSHRGDAEPHSRADPGTRPARRRPDGADYASTDRATFAAPGRPRPRDTSGTPRTALSPTLRFPGGD